jgi:hypothetical protein
MTPMETMEEAEAEALRRFAERAEEVRQNLEEAFHEALPGNHSPADAVMLAHLMTAKDGYNDVQFIGEWEKRPQKGWQTSIAFLATLDRGLIVPFAAEARYEDHVRQLAIVIDRERPGERSPPKLQRENALMARGYRVIAFTELEILSNPEDCRDRVENVLFEMIEDAMVDAGVISGSPRRG